MPLSGDSRGRGIPSSPALEEDPGPRLTVMLSKRRRPLARPWVKRQAHSYKCQGPA